MNLQYLLVLSRVFSGVIFLESVSIKLFTTSTASTQIDAFVGKFGMTHAYGWYRNFLQNVVMQHVNLFANLVVIGEVYVGLALIFGVTTRLASAVAVLMLVNFLLTKGMQPWIMSQDLPNIVLCLIVMLGAAGRTLGVDRHLHERFPKVPIW